MGRSGALRTAAKSGSVENRRPSNNLAEGAFGSRLSPCHIQRLGRGPSRLERQAAADRHWVASSRLSKGGPNSHAEPFGCRNEPGIASCIEHRAVAPPQRTTQDSHLLSHSILTLPFASCPSHHTQPFDQASDASRRMRTIRRLADRPRISRTFHWTSSLEFERDPRFHRPQATRRGHRLEAVTMAFAHCPLGFGLGRPACGVARWGRGARLSKARRSGRRRRW
jgi:hypothetical protein